MIQACDFIRSLTETKGAFRTDELLSWIMRLNETASVSVTETAFTEDGFWYLDLAEGSIHNAKRTFFSIRGIEKTVDGVAKAQPILVQAEIGYLGILVKRMDGVLHFLMQAKIEPGNVNCVQISPTIQATKSNFTRAHGGKQPDYLEYFLNAPIHRIVYDQLQSEQGSRFYRKRNRNMIVETEEDVPVTERFRWMTLGQIKQLMRLDNLVNMDTRSVLAGIPFGVSDPKELLRITHALNDRRMFDSDEAQWRRLDELKGWQMGERGLFRTPSDDFDVRLYDIAIEGREVRRWTQPLVRAIGRHTFGLVICQGKALIALRDEVGSFDGAELSPTVYWTPTHGEEEDTPIDAYYRRCRQNGDKIVSVVLSEEGGRFYHEENCNEILLTDEFVEAPKGYDWVSIGSLFALGQSPHRLNIQLRSLLSLLPKELLI